MLILSDKPWKYCKLIKRDEVKEREELDCLVPCIQVTWAWWHLYDSRHSPEKLHDCIVIGCLTICCSYSDISISLEQLLHLGLWCTGSRGQWCFVWGRCRDKPCSHISTSYLPYRQIHFSIPLFHHHVKDGSQQYLWSFNSFMIY